MPKVKLDTNRTLEDKLFRFLLSIKGMTYKDFYTLYSERAKEPGADHYSYSGFMGWLTNYGLKFCRIPRFLSLLGYRVVVVPSKASLSLKLPDDERLETLPNPSEENCIQVVTMDEKSKIVCVEEMSSHYTLKIRKRR